MLEQRLPYRQTSRQEQNSLPRGTAVEHDGKELVAEQFAQLLGELCQR